MGAEHKRRAEDNLLGRLNKYWIIITSLFVVGVTLYELPKRMDKIEEQVEQADTRMDNLESMDKVHAHMLQEIRESLQELRRDQKEILRRVR